MRMVRRKASSSAGFALLAVLWVSAMLSTVAMGISTSARLRGTEAMNAHKSLQYGYLLESGLEIARFEYLKYAANPQLVNSQEATETVTGTEVDIKHPRYEPYDADIKGEELTFRIVDLFGRFNVNTLSPELWRKVLALCGMEQGEAMDTVVDSVVDWQDNDDLKRFNGAEDDYYEALDEPYLCKNGEFQNIEELLLVNGVSRELYHGTEEHPGLKDFLAVQGVGKKLNVNSAAPAAFGLIEGLPQEVVDGIVDLRAEKPILDMSELNTIVPFEFTSQLNEFFTTQASGTVTLEAEVRGFTASTTYTRNR